MKKKALTITASLLVAGGLLIAMLIGSIGYFTGQVISTSKEDEKLYFDHLYDISQLLINADRDDEAYGIAKNEPGLFTGTPLEGKTFQDYYTENVENFKAWEAVYDVETGSGDYALFVQNFETARTSLSDMTDITETWAVAKKAERQAAITRSIIVSVIIFLILSVAVLAVAIVVIAKMRKSLKYIVSAVGEMAGGNFSRLNTLWKTCAPVSRNLFLT